MPQESSKYMNDGLVRELESLVGRIIADAEVDDKDYTFPRWTVSDRRQLEIGECIYLDDDQIWAYHLGLKVLRGAGINPQIGLYELQFPSSICERGSVPFSLDHSYEEDCPPNRVEFIPADNDEDVRMIYTREIAKSINEVLRERRGFVTELCDLAEIYVSSNAFEFVGFECTKAIDFKLVVPALNRGNHQRYAELIQRMEESVKKHLA